MHIGTTTSQQDFMQPPDEPVDPAKVCYPLTGMPKVAQALSSRAYNVLSL